MTSSLFSLSNALASPFPSPKEVRPPSDVDVVSSWIHPVYSGASELLLNIEVQSACELVAQGKLLSTKWKDLEWIFRSSTVHRNPARLLWMIAHTVSNIELLGVDARASADSWFELWNSVRPVAVARNEIKVDSASTVLQIMVAAALHYRLHYPVKEISSLSAINQAAGVLVGCILPSRSNKSSEMDRVLPSSDIVRVREWLLDSLEKSPYPFADQYLPA
jgi:hypothetical protein